MYNEADKKKIYKWREGNREAYNELNRKYVNAYNLRNKDKLQAKRYLKSEWKLLCNIAIL
jgi:post-segregation antitoxin (ccd killing protein)